MTERMPTKAAQSFLWQGCKKSEHGGVLIPYIEVNG